MAAGLEKVRFHSNPKEGQGQSMFRLPWIVLISSILAWKIPWTEQPGRLQSMGSLRFGHDWSDLAVAVLPKAHLTSHSRISGSRWVATLSWLSRSLRPVLYSSVYSRHLFLISLIQLFGSRIISVWCFFRVSTSLVKHSLCSLIVSWVHGTAFLSFLVAWIST